MIANQVFWKDKKVFITGITGFKGSWLALMLLKLGSKVKGFALPPESQPSHFAILDLSCEIIFGDIRNADLISKEIEDFKPDIVFHLAAQSLVRKSYKEPLETYSTNVMGTLHVLEASKLSNVGAIVVVTSDKVYENYEWIWPYRENDVLGGFDIYSSSKACTEILTRSFQRSFMPLDQYQNTHSSLVATVRAGNVIGGGDWSEDRLIPDLIRAATENKPVEIRNPNSVRPWQHVLDPLSGYLALGEKLLQGDTVCADAWNFGPNPDAFKSVEEIIAMMQTCWDKVSFKRENISRQLHEASFLTVDSTKARTILQWNPKWDVKVAVEKTAIWYKEYVESSVILSQQQLDEYFS